MQPIEVKRTRLAKLDPMAISTRLTIDPNNEALRLRRMWAFGAVDEKELMIANIGEVEVDKGGFWRGMFNFGTLVLKGSNIEERVSWVKNPHYYQQIIIKIKENQNAKRN
jgi:hypothetical protein